MTLTEMKIIATVAAADIGVGRPFPDSTAIDTTRDQLQDALDMGLKAVLENVKAKFPHVYFMVVD